MSKSTNQKGSVSVLIAAAVVVLVVGFASYSIWHVRQQVPGASTSATQPHYLAIKEWGIKLPVSGDYSYTFQSNDNVRIRDKRTDAAAQAIGCSPDESYVARMFRSATVEPGPAVYSSKINGYYYAITFASQALCYDAPGYKADEDLVNQYVSTDDAVLMAAMPYVTAQ